MWSILFRFQFLSKCRDTGGLYPAHRSTGICTILVVIGKGRRPLSKGDTVLVLQLHAEFRIHDDKFFLSSFRYFFLFLVFVFHSFFPPFFISFLVYFLLLLFLILQLLFKNLCCSYRHACTCESGLAGITRKWKEMSGNERERTGSGHSVRNLHFGGTY